MAAAGVTIVLVPAVKAALTGAGTVARRGTTTQASHPSARAPGATAPASAPLVPAPVPVAGDPDWLAGLDLLQRQMNNAMHAGTITPISLRLTAATLRRCTPELAALGPPARPYRQTYQLARRACADFDQAAALSVAAARAYATTAGPGSQLNTLLNRSDAAFNHGVDLMSQAYYGAPIVAG